MLLARTRPTAIAVENLDGTVYITLDVTTESSPVAYAPAQRLIELHDGTVQHRDGRTVVAFPATESRRGQRKSRTCRILVVEDDDIGARATQMMLEQLGYTVAIAHDGAVALEVARVFRPDIALIDIQLPVLDGWEVARRLRERLGELPLVAVTGHDGEEAQRRSREAGFADHFCKPIDLDALDRRLGDLRPAVAS
jgi:CheY-like chemotaxis protein